jgi:hypothetical protein
MNLDGSGVRDEVAQDEIPDDLDGNRAFDPADPGPIPWNSGDYRVPDLLDAPARALRIAFACGARS